MKIDFDIYGPGRPLLPETVAKLKAMLEAIRKEPGIQSAKLAKRLRISSLECANLSRKLEKRELISVETVRHARCYRPAGETNV